ncbi:MAG: aminopeptidase [Acetivibrio sp.]
MSGQDRIKEENEQVMERYELSMERIQEIIYDCGVKEKYQDYFVKTAKFFMSIKQVYDWVESGELRTFSIEKLQKMNKDLYGDILGAAYEKSYGNPDYAVSCFDKEYGQLLSFLYTEIRGCIAYAFESRLFDITITGELFIEIYNLMEEEDGKTYKSMKSAIYYFFSDYSDITLERRMQELLNPKLTFAVDIIEKENLRDLRYLYYFGEYITENELKIAEFLNACPEEEIEKMAATFTEGYRLGFENYKIDLSKKEVVNIRYNLGFERMVKAAIGQFEKMGLKTVIYRAAVSSIHKKQNLKIGFHGSSANKQYDYDHRFDNALYMDKAFNDRKLAVTKSVYESMKEMASKFAGPAVIGTFGETPFTPKNKENAFNLTDKQQKLSVEYQREFSILSNKYLKNDEISFTMIDYPIPEIGAQFKEIFAETVKVNTLDMKMYKKIQQDMIDALDQGEFVTITGKGKNRTSLKVQMQKINHPEQETNFENCLADVNIPVGEVFTSPKLEGTQGVLHVTEVFLQGLNFIDLELVFEDGKIIEYTCRNFEKEEENKKYIKENILYQHDTLPIGEFAIGTNTTAYVMGKKYGISPLLPILIAEKTGPHFAVGDTCFKMSEDMKTYNPDGKEMTAKENTCSAQRKTNMEKAYFNCHTDITIPYNELGDILVHKKNGETIFIVKEGKFVLPGTEELNRPLQLFENRV